LSIDDYSKYLFLTGVNDRSFLV